MNIFPENQLKVHYPEGGLHYILNWWSDNERNHLILARTKESAENTFRSVLDVHFDAEPKDFFSANIVSPAQKYCDAYAAESLAENVMTFWHTFCYTALEYKNQTGALPPQMKECPGFVPIESDIEEDEYHYGCANCKGCRVLPIDGTYESVYLKHREKFLKSLSYRTYGHDKVVSKAPIQNMDRPLYAAKPNFGHHASGVETAQSVDIEHMYQDFLFFYQNPQTVDISIAKALYESKQEQMKKKREEAKRKHEVEIKDMRDHKFKDLLEFFGEEQ